MGEPTDRHATDGSESEPVAGGTLGNCYKESVTS